MRNRMARAVSGGGLGSSLHAELPHMQQRSTVLDIMRSHLSADKHSSAELGGLDYAYAATYESWWC